MSSTKQNSTDIILT